MRKVKCIGAIRLQHALSTGQEEFIPGAEYMLCEEDFDRIKHSPDFEILESDKVEEVKAEEPKEAKPAEIVSPYKKRMTMDEIKTEESN